VDEGMLVDVVGEVGDAAEAPPVVVAPPPAEAECVLHPFYDDEGRRYVIAYEADVLHMDFPFVNVTFTAADGNGLTLDVAEGQVTLSAVMGRVLISGNFRNRDFDE